ncbi:EPIDERMAL PATTERNING FACTOR-like protein 2 [Tripterygium wilfordii]|uniref:EPIDERMAL PATTERNING FACTOR-like protein 2 n=1 Tax=Tripterygium wilfordii TaxID=458696 RepID=UPI0018F83DC0|nr:EPIDERMAL PATTERNING FACTOR-like protein 2 [Tripterygium wilfordii]
MGRTQNWLCCHRSRHLIISVLLLLVSSLTQVRFIAAGRGIRQLKETALVREHSPMYSPKHEEKKIVVVRSLIGSSPPRCERRCSNCGHCEAVQVPVTTKVNGHYRRSSFVARTPIVAYSRGEDISNYKPMSWKCKCGDLIFNP